MFPIDWTTTSVINFLPDLCEKFGYDLPLTTKLNLGSPPVFSFSANNLNNVSFGLDLHLILEQTNKTVAVLKIENLTAEFSIKLHNKLVDLREKKLKVIMKKMEVEKVKIEGVEGDENIAREFVEFNLERIMEWIIDGKYTEYNVPKGIIGIIEFNKSLYMKI